MTPFYHWTPPVVATRFLEAKLSGRALLIPVCRGSYGVAKFSILRGALGRSSIRPPAYMVRGARGQQRCCYLGDLVDVFGFVVKLQKHSRMKNGFGRLIAH
jgi:hypothetical protein